MKRSGVPSMHEHSTPEERLLKLIRKGPRPSALAGAKKKDSLWGTASKDSDQNFFKPLERFLVIVIALFFLYIVYIFFFTGQDPRAVLTQAEKSFQKEEFEKIVVAEVRPSAYYTLPVQQRNIFGNSSSVPVIAAASVPELTRNLKLVGIILGKTPEAVIEDTEGKQTFFLKKGESFKNAIVEEIQEKKVILLVGGQRIELAQ